jgi:hypothetical protein
VLPLKNRVIRDSAVQLGLNHQRGAFELVLTHRVALGVGLKAVAFPPPV